MNKFRKIEIFRISKMTTVNAKLRRKQKEDSKLDAMLKGAATGSRCSKDYSEKMP